MDRAPSGDNPVSQHVQKLYEWAMVERRSAP
jgi:hypothetical protein